jgi:pilus assembly protein CpaF
MTMYNESLRAFLRPVLPFLDDPAVSEIMINGPEDVWVEKKGRLSKVEARFTEEGLVGAARNMAQFVGRVLSDERPRLDARLPDGSRIHVVLAPIARRGTTISIRKFFKEKLAVASLLKFGSLSEPMAKLLEVAICTKLNVVVAGGTGSGKTTLLNIISSLIPDDERILTIEDSAELQLSQVHLVPFESRPPDKFGKGGVDMGDLLHSALRLRPDRIVVGEVRGGEAFHLIQAMNTGHGGSLATTHANTPTDTLRRLESLCLMSAVELPLVAVRAQVASAVHLVVCCDRLQDGSRKVTHISEVLPLNEKGDYRTQDLFVFTPVAKGAAGEVLGYHAPTGVLPTFLGKARTHGFEDLDERFFDPATYGLPAPPVFARGQAFVTRWAPSLRHREGGEPDPERLQAHWAELEGRLHTVQQAPAPAPSPRPKSTSQPHARPLRPPIAPDDDLTPAPTHNPLPPERTRPLVVDEPKVEINAELLEDPASILNDPGDTGISPLPFPPPARGEARPPGPRRTAHPPEPSELAEAEEPADELPESDRTHIRPFPTRPRR